METNNTAIIELQDGDNATESQIPAVSNVKQFRGINFSGDFIIKQTDHLPENQKALMRWLFAYAREKHLDWDDLTKGVGVSSTVLHRIWSDKYRDPKNPDRRIPIDSIAEKIQQFRILVEKREELTANEFIMTDTAKKIHMLCDKCLTLHKMGLIYGQSHIGKTWALQEFKRLHNHGQTSYVEMPAVASKQVLAREIARALHISPDRSTERLREAIFTALDSGKLLIVDEVQRAFTTYPKALVMYVLEFIREIYNHTNCAMVICGTQAFRAGIEKSEFSQYLQQFRRRAGNRVLDLLNTNPWNDLVIIGKNYGLPEPTGLAREIVDNINHKNGLAVYVDTLIDAVNYAKRRKAILTWDHFIHVYEISMKMSGGL